MNKCSAVSSFVYSLVWSHDSFWRSPGTLPTPLNVPTCFTCLFQAEGHECSPFVPSLSFTGCGESNSASSKDSNFPAPLPETMTHLWTLSEHSSQTLGEGGCGVAYFAQGSQLFSRWWKGQITSGKPCPYSTLLERCPVLYFRGKGEAFLKRGQKTVWG